MYPSFERIVGGLTHVFMEGLRVDTPEGTVLLRQYNLGPLTLTSGEIVACDPKWIEEDTIIPFTVRVAPGTYPVMLTIARFDSGDERVAYATLRLSEQPPIRWEPALFLDHDVDQMSRETSRVPAYSVDSGKGCFMDADAARVWTERLAIDEDYALRINDELDPRRLETWSWANLDLEPDTRANLVVFTTGLGDDAYASYFGFDASSQAPVCPTTDFALLWGEAQE